MLVNELNVIFLGFILISTTQQTSEAKIYFIRYIPDLYNRYPVKYVPPVAQGKYNKKLERADPGNLIFNVIKLINEKQKLKTPLNEDNIGNKCARLFGSIYGTKEQRLLCLKKLERKKTILWKPKNYLSVLQDDFNDLTRAIYSPGIQIKKSKREFSTDYIDFNDLRAGKKRANKYRKDFSQDYVDFSELWGRKGKLRNRNRRMTSIKRKGDTSSDGDSDESIEDKKKYYKVPKRFQVIDNGESKTKDNSDEYFEEDSDTDSNKPVPKKDSSSENTSEDNTKNKKESSSEEYQRPKVVYKKKKPEYYLQGNRLVDPSGRRRLPHFLPKRFHWKEDEIHNLGYYWFNGPQGKYPYFAERP